MEDFSSYIGKLSTPRELVSAPPWSSPLRVSSAERCVLETRPAQAVLLRTALVGCNAFVATWV